MSAKPCDAGIVRRLLLGSANDRKGSVGPFRSTEQLSFAQLFVIGDPTARIGARLPLRVLVTFEDPEMFPGCVPGVLASVEAINRGTRQTQYILANPVITDIPARR